MRSKKTGLKIIITFSVIALLAVAGFLLFVNTGYKADDYALGMLVSDDTFQVSETDYGLMFDGPGDSDVLVFYPGGRVEPEAYAPLLREFAENGMDVCLVDMPLDLAVFGQNKADEVIPLYDYENLYIGGHSLGGAMAALYASEHPDVLDGVILLAAYPTAPLDDSLAEIVLVGSEDHVIDWGKLEEGRQYSPSSFTEYVIDGGNHAQFGSYGAQRGDGTASITQQEQVDQTVNIVISSI